MTEEQIPGDAMPTNQIELVEDEFECDGGIEVFGGSTVYPFAANASDFDLTDIAHALGSVCRFGGHSRWFYSVAEHCVLMLRHARIALGGTSDAVARLILLHDGSEAYLGDMVRPLKQRMPEFREIENRLQVSIERCFGCAEGCEELIARLDVQMLAMEQAKVMCSRNVWPVVDGVDPAEVTPEFWRPKSAKNAFLAEFRRVAPREDSA